MPILGTNPDLILHGGRIYTVDAKQPWAKAVAVRKHRIMAVGSDADILALAGPATRTISLEGRLVLPGLCDAHIHFYDWSLGLQEIELADCTSKAEMLARIAARADELPAGTWITGRGWNESRWGEVAFPTATDLDSVTGLEQPAIFWRTDMHGAVANSAAIALAGIDAKTAVAGGVIERDEDGIPTGVFKELAIRLISDQIPPPDPGSVEAALRQGMQTLHANGITAIHDQRMKDHDDGPRAFGVYQELAAARALQLRINCNVAAHDLPHLVALGLRSGFGNDYVRLGHVKVFSDGSLGSRTAAMLHPFIEPEGQAGQGDNVGVLITPVAEMAENFRQAIEIGFPISVHAIGDRANRTVLDIFEELSTLQPAPPAPHRIEHVQIVDPIDLPRLSRLGITASVQPIHVTDDMDSADLLVGERGAHMYNFRSLLDDGTLLALGSDAPVADVNPFLGFHAALFRRRVDRPQRPAWYRNERITLPEVIYGYTLGAARAAGWQQVIGSITAGKRADMIVLDRDLFAVTESGSRGNAVAEATVDLTIFDGQVVYAKETTEAYTRNPNH